MEDMENIEERDKMTISNPLDVGYIDLAPLYIVVIHHRKRSLPTLKQLVRGLPEGYFASPRSVSPLRPYGAPPPNPSDLGEAQLETGVSHEDAPVFC